MTARCDECVYSAVRSMRNPRPGRVGGVRECRRFPPLPDGAPWGGITGPAWPVVLDDDWCGEFRQNDAEAVEMP